VLILGGVNFEINEFGGDIADSRQILLELDRIPSHKIVILLYSAPAKLKKRYGRVWENQVVWDP